MHACHASEILIIIQPIHCRSAWHHLAGAFLLGVIVAYGILNFTVHPLNDLRQGPARKDIWGPEAARDNWDCAHSGPYPFAVGNETMDFKPPDKLIVAARHSDVKLLSWI